MVQYITKNIDPKRMSSKSSQGLVLYHIAYDRYIVTTVLFVISSNEHHNFVGTSDFGSTVRVPDFNSIPRLV